MICHWFQETFYKNLILAHLACSEHQRCITLPNYKGNRGNPVLWGAAFFPELKELRGDIGGRKLLQDHFAAHNSVEIATPAILHDIDTLSDLKTWKGLVSSGPRTSFG